MDGPSWMIQDCKMNNHEIKHDVMLIGLTCFTPVGHSKQLKAASLHRRYILMGPRIHHTTP